MNKDGLKLMVEVQKPPVVLVKMYVVRKHASIAVIAELKNLCVECWSSLG